jgi:chromosome segregation ATPase
MTIDETGNPVETNMNDLVAFEPRSAFNDEEITMIQTALAAISNRLVGASNLAQKYEALAAEVAELRKEVQQANHFREIADQAYQQVNAQRIAAESELTTTRTELVNTKATLVVVREELDIVRFDLSVAKTRIASLEEDASRVIREADEMIAAAVAKADARVRAVEEDADRRVLAAEAKARDRSEEFATLRSRVGELERDNNALRAIFADAQAVMNGKFGVAAE